MRTLVLSVLAMLCIFAGGTSYGADAAADLPDGFYLVLEDPGEATADTVVIAQEGHPGEPVKVERKMLVSAHEIARAWVSADKNYGGNVINIEMTSSGGALLHAATTRIIGHRMAIVVGGVAISVPMIMSPVGEKLQITGNFGATEAKAIAERLTRH